MIELISDIGYNFTKSLVDDNTLSIFISNSCQNKSFIKNLISKVDNLLNIDFTITKNINKSDIIFREKKNIIIDSNVYYGFAYPYNNVWNLSIERKLQTSYKKYVYVHEFGHSLGLEHPFDNSDGDFWNSTTTKDTIMSYNYVPSKKQFFRSLDRDTLTGLWNT